jgi:hypothetical protein
MPALELVDGEHQPQGERQRRREAETRAGNARADAGDVDREGDAVGDPAEQQGGAQERRMPLARKRRAEVADEGRDARKSQRHRGGAKPVEAAPNDRIIVQVYFRTSAASRVRA